MRQSIEQHGWDGAWYRRAYFDDGTPLGSASEHRMPDRLDLAELGGAVGHGVRREARGYAIGSVRASPCSPSMQQLVKRDASTHAIAGPALRHLRTLDPGYIRGYVPGVRENGGQYTHAAIWAAMAFAKLGDNERAWELLQHDQSGQPRSDPAGIATYKIEPYVVAADVYSVAPHVGRGGWSWYTGSAGWMYRLMLESLLGLRSVMVDGVEQHDKTIPLVDDRRDHSVAVMLQAR
jgi:cyclic beta-1,2-glucan synthetase